MDDHTRPLSPRTTPPSRRELVEGEVLGAWSVVRLLAHGGFGTVYHVRHVRTNQEAALKLLHAHLVTSAEMLARFDREIQVISRMRHPNIVQLVDAGFTSDHRPYLCMELVEGDELTKLVGTAGLAPNIVLAILEQLCDALALAHELGIVHRDIKSSNVLVGRARPGEDVGRVVLLDFGIAKLSDALAPELTATNQSLGTPACMAPEQIHGMRPDARTDVYALGGLLFHMLTGRLPFHDPSSTMTQYLHLHARRPSASAIADVTERIDEVVARAMAIDADARYPDVMSVLAATRAALRDTTAVSTVSVGESSGILVTVGDRSGGSALDESLLQDLEAVLPAAERFLVERNYVPALDLGTSAVFVARPQHAKAAVDVACALWEHLERRQGRDARVQIGLGVHRDEATFVGAQIQSASLLRPATWRLPDTFEGVWITSAIDPSAATGRRMR